MNDLRHLQPNYRAELPRSDEGMNICDDIGRWQNYGYLARGFRISNQAVSKWFDRRVTDIFTRVRDFLRGLLDDGRPDIAVRILRFICSGIGYYPVKISPKKVQFLSLFRSACQHQLDSAHLNELFFEVIKDGVLTLEEVERMLAEIDEERQALTNMEALYKSLREDCKTSGRKIAIDVDKFKNQMMAG